MRDSTRSTVLNVLVGLVFLAVVFVFTVLVPEIGDDPAASYAASETESDTASDTGSETPDDLDPVVLPEVLPLDLVAVDSGDLPDELAAQFGDLEVLREQQESIGVELEALFGDAGAFRLYGATDGSSLVSVTVLDRAPGLFVPEAPPVDADVRGLERAAVELVDVDGTICSLAWGADVPAGEPIDPAALPQSVRCQRGEGERTFEISAQGLALEDTLAVLDAIQQT